MNSASFRILRDLLSKETHGCRWCMRIGFSDLVRSWVADHLPFFISLNPLSLSVSMVPSIFIAGFSLACCLIASTIILVLFDAPFR